jgi:hypothetical protein
MKYILIARKHLICAIVLVLFCAMAGFAQDSAMGKKSAITIDLMPLFKGFIASDRNADTFLFCFSTAYERLIRPHFSIGFGMDLYPGKIFDIDVFYFSMVTTGRFYPMSGQMEKLFLGTILGFNVLSIDGRTRADDGGFLGLLIGLNAGYRLMMGNIFFVEPSMSYTYAKTGVIFNPPHNIGWQAGLRIGIEF